MQSDDHVVFMQGRVDWEFEAGEAYRVYPIWLDLVQRALMRWSQMNHRRWSPVLLNVVASWLGEDRGDWTKWRGRCGGRPAKRIRV